MTTMIVTNGSMLTDEFLTANMEALDWIALSIDSLNRNTNILSGRAIAGKKALTLDCYTGIIEKVKSYEYGLKINTVVNSLNYQEDMNDFIAKSKPARWKIFQVLPITGQNDQYIDALKITDPQFNTFIANHQIAAAYTVVIPESNNAMKGSYAMVDPAGRFYDNTNGVHHYSRSIVDIGCRLAFQQVNYDIEKFISRGGLYDWKT